MVPSCQLKARFVSFHAITGEIPSFQYCVKLLGAKEPYDEFNIIPSTVVTTNTEKKGIIIQYIVSLPDHSLRSAGCIALPARGGRVWPLWHRFCDRCWNVNMTNEIQARVMIKILNAPGV